MNPPEDEKYRDYSSPAHEIYVIINDTCAYITPVLEWLISIFRKIMRTVKKYRP